MSNKLLCLVQAYKRQCFFQSLCSFSSFPVDKRHFYTVEIIVIDLLDKDSVVTNSHDPYVPQNGSVPLMQEKQKISLFCYLFLHNACCSFCIFSSVQDSCSGNEEWLAISAALTCFLSMFSSIHQQNHIIRGH